MFLAWLLSVNIIDKYTVSVYMQKYNIDIETSIFGRIQCDILHKYYYCTWTTEQYNNPRHQNYLEIHTSTKQKETCAWQTYYAYFITKMLSNTLCNTCIVCEHY